MVIAFQQKNYFTTKKPKNLYVIGEVKAKFL